MSSIAFSNASPFAMALPQPNVFVEYDADGDVIMTDALTGLPLVYGQSSGKRSRSASLDSEGTDSRPSKRRRISPSVNDEADGEGAAAPVASVFMTPPRAAVPPVCPPAPKKARLSEGDGEDDSYSPLRNLAQQMAEAVLAGEPRSPLLAAVGPGSAVGAGAGPAQATAPLGGQPQEEPWVFVLNVDDFALRLDMRHPRVVLSYLRFVESYNSYVPEPEQIHLPKIKSNMVAFILGHSSVLNPAPEFVEEVDELRRLVRKYASEVDEWSSIPSALSAEQNKDWCVGLKCKDMALPLEMRHPLTLLALLQFVECYNEIAPEGETINLPWLSRADEDYVREHPFCYLYDVNDHEHHRQAEHLRILLCRYSCGCAECAHDANVSDSDSEHSYSTEDYDY